MEDGIDLYIDVMEMKYLYSEEKHQLDKCIHCSQSVDKSFEYCPYCGRKL